MKLISFNQSGFPALGILEEGADGNRVLPVTSWAASDDVNCPVSMQDVLQDWTYWKGRLGELPGESRPEHWVPIADVEILAPVPRPGSLTGMGLNYRDHDSEPASRHPTEPVIFAKHPSCIVGPGSDIILPNASNEVDYGAELAVVIGLPVFHPDESEARNAIVGYTIMNDVTARDWQNRTSQWMAAKSFPSFGPMGPVVVTTDELESAGSLRISSSVNGTLRHDSATSEMIFDVVDIVRYVSSVWPLAPGDVIATGTPAGAGFSRRPAAYLRAGDLVEISIEGIGVLSNRVIAADGTAKDKSVEPQDTFVGRPRQLGPPLNQASDARSRGATEYPTPST